MNLRGKMNAYNLNAVQQTMVSGSHKAGCIESTADCCLWCPACMWRGRNVRLVIDGDEDVPKLRYRASSASLFWGVGGGGGPYAVFGIGIAYSAASLVAAPLLAVGSCLKNIAFCVDPTAAAYNELATNHLSELGDMSEIDRSLQDGYSNLPDGNSNVQRLFQIANLETKLGLEKRKLQDKKDLLLIANDDIEKYSLQWLKPFLGQNQNLLLVYDPFVKEDSTIDYKISTCEFSKKKISTTHSLLLEEIKGHQMEIANLEEKLLEIDTEMEEYRKLPEKFLEEAIRLTNNENDSLI